MTVQAETCRHYWVIEPALGQYSEGTCRECGEQKTFTNFAGRQEYPDPQPTAEPRHEEPIQETDDEVWPVVQAYLRSQL